MYSDRSGVWRGSEVDHPGRVRRGWRDKKDELDALPAISECLKKHCQLVRLKRFDEKEGSFEATFQVDFNNFEAFQKGRADLGRLSSSIEFNFIDTRAVP